jgi:Xaa-Pro aminopeptidase
MNLASLQSFMLECRIDAWLLYDFRGNNAVLAQLLPGKRWTTRRVFALIPARGEPVVLAHGIDFSQFASLPPGVRAERYLTWQEMRAWLAAKLAGMTRVAMEYAPGCSLPVVSIADAGTVELVRSLGVEVASSADLIQVSVATWSAEAVEKHALASRQVAAIKDEAFALIRERTLAGKGVNEREVQQLILSRFAAEGLETVDPPIVAANAHAGDPHFEVSEKESSPIRRGDWVLIDLWARRPGDENIFSDITWVGFVPKERGAGPRPEHQKAFLAVKAARDASLRAAQEAWKKKERTQGWRLDDAARNELARAGFESAVRHRTGHSLSPGPKVHGMGMNLDNLETHDTREMLPGTGFTIEPGVYLPEFGVRLEINVFVDPARGPIVTSCIQEEPVVLG